MKNLIDATKEKYERVNLLGIPALYTCARVDRKTVPAGMYMYEVRYSDEGFEPCQLGNWIMVNFYGTILTKQPFNLVKSRSINNAYLDFDYEHDWNPDGYGWTINFTLHNEYLKTA